MWWSWSCRCDGESRASGSEAEVVVSDSVGRATSSCLGEDEEGSPMSGTRSSKYHAPQGVQRWSQQLDSPHDSPIISMLSLSKNDEEDSADSAAKSAATDATTTASSSGAKPSPKSATECSADTDDSRTPADAVAVAPGPLVRPLPPHSHASYAALEAAFPEAPSAELRRFARARPKAPDALKMYKAYRHWREGDGHPDALAQALSIVPGNWIAGSSTCGVAKDGTGVIFIEGARMDISLEPHNYTQAICRAVDDMLSADSEAQITALLDVRPGGGWPNPPAMEVVPFVRDLVKTVMGNYPERLHRLVVYPVHSGIVFLVNVMLRAIDSSLRQKIQLATEKDFMDHLREHVTKANLPERAWPRHPGL